MIWFTSDTHFDHANIIKFCNRPFGDVNEMNEALISNWNAAVGQNDTVYHLGDFAYKSTPVQTREFANRLNGTKFLVGGNHEGDFKAASGLRRWTTLPLYHELHLGKQKVVLCHYAFRTWHHDLRGAWHLYGHSHNELPPLGKSVDVGVDRWNFTPVSFDQIHSFMENRPVHDAPKFKNYVPEAL